MIRTTRSRATREHADRTLADVAGLATQTTRLTELSVHVTLNLLTNYFNHFVQTDLDIPAAPEI